jgi:hypothetical protein
MDVKKGKEKRNSENECCLYFFYLWMFFYNKIAKNKEKFNVDLLTVNDYELTRKSYF